MQSVFKCLFAVIISAVAFSCTNKRLFDEVQKISPDGWHKTDSISFIFQISDTSQAYNILLHLRNKTSYRNSNLWLFINTTAPNGETITDTVEFFLAEPSGRWLGKGLGAVNSMLVPYKTNIRFPYRGIYRFDFRQAMREDTLEGIIDIGMRVQLHK
ncbi:MAG: gliding motility lipoprotein GldH [Bacteroidales bacterium]|nr:gliding motility lipoprotein GldH [Bacteroidales bacterium]